MSPVAWATLNLHQDTPRLHWDQYLSLPHFLSLSSLLRVALEKISYTWLFRINLLKPKHQLWPLHPSLALQTLFYSSSLHCRSSPQPLIHLRLQFCSIINPEDFQNCLQHIQISYQRLFLNLAHISVNSQPICLNLGPPDSTHWYLSIGPRFVYIRPKSLIQRVFHNWLISQPILIWFTWILDSLNLLIQSFQSIQ